MRRLRAVREEHGYSLIEMVTVMVIIGIVLTSLTTLFVQGTNAEMDMNRRFQAQQAARLALDKMRREIHCAKEVQTPGASGQAATVTLRLQAQCPTAVNNAQTDVTWCTVSVAPNRWALHRKVGSTCDNAGVKWADYLSASAIFDYQTQSASQLSRLRVHFPVDVKPQDASPAYTLCDIIVLRNSSRKAPTSDQLGYLDTANPQPCT